MPELRVRWMETGLNDERPKPTGLLAPLLRAGHKVEGGLGMFFGTLLTLIFAGLIVFMNQDAWSDRGVWARVGWAAAAAGWLCLDLPYLVRLWRVAFRGTGPITFDAAARQRVAPVP